MEFSTKTQALERLSADLLALPVWGTSHLGEAGEAINQASKQAISAAIKAGDLPAKAGSTLLLRVMHPIGRVLLVRMSEKPEASHKEFVAAVQTAVRAAQSLGCSKLASALAQAPVKGREPMARVHAEILAVAQTQYRADALKSKPEPKSALREVIVVADRTSAKAVQIAMGKALALAQGMSLAKDLGNLPPNVCTPSYLAEQARILGREQGLKVQVLDAKQMKALGMGSLLAVAQGSEQPPQFIIVQHRGGPAKQAPVVLVGKGITFDTGGISLKPAADMDEMKYDMCGAASVLGTMKSIALMKLPLNVVALVPTCENMPSGKATRPGDIVTSMSGQTIEILNTDAEGRLILCDALTYAERFKPAAVIDVATLTGACVIALGHEHSGLFSSDDRLAQELLDAGMESQDTAWRMPLDEAYAEGLKSNFADVANVGGRAGGAITAACFLARFTKAYPWAHLDIAGTAWKSGALKGSTARPVPLLTAFLAARAAKS
jgi:leucyl aminopeptidase